MTAHVNSEMPLFPFLAPVGIMMNNCHKNSNWFEMAKYYGWTERSCWLNLAKYCLLVPKLTSTNVALGDKDATQSILQWTYHRPQTRSASYGGTCRDPHVGDVSVLVLNYCGKIHHSHQISRIWPFAE